MMLYEYDEERGLDMGAPGGGGTKSSLINLDDLEGRLLTDEDVIEEGDSVLYGGDSFTDLIWRRDENFVGLTVARAYSIKPSLKACWRGRHPSIKPEVPAQNRFRKFAVATVLPSVSCSLLTYGFITSAIPTLNVLSVVILLGSAASLVYKLARL